MTNVRTLLKRVAPDRVADYDDICATEEATDVERLKRICVLLETVPTEASIQLKHKLEVQMVLFHTEGAGRPLSDEMADRVLASPNPTPRVKKLVSICTAHMPMGRWRKYMTLLMMAMTNKEDKMVLEALLA